MTAVARVINPVKVGGPVMRQSDLNRHQHDHRDGNKPAQPPSAGSVVRSCQAHGFHDRHSTGILADGQIHQKNEYPNRSAGNVRIREHTQDGDSTTWLARPITPPRLPPTSLRNSLLINKIDFYN